MSTSDYLSIISLVITMVMGLPGTILAIIQIRDALKPGKGRHHQRGSSPLTRGQHIANPRIPPTQPP